MRQMLANALLFTEGEEFSARAAVLTASTFIAQLGKIPVAHFNETYLAWSRAQDSAYPAHGHVLRAVEAIEPTCTAEGRSAHWECEVCGLLFSDEAGAHEIDAASTVLPKVAHQWGPWTVVREATPKLEGLEQRTCSVCGEVEERALAYVKPVGTVWQRLSGATALDTMRAVVSMGFEKADTVVIATSGTYHDALAASALAGSLKAPVLLTEPGVLSAQTKEQIAALKPSRAYVVGGEYWTPQSVLDELEKLDVKVERVAGPDACGTAIEVGRALGKKAGTVAIVAFGGGYHDALAASPYSYAKVAPIYLTDEAGGVDAATISAMKAAGIKQVLICGGPMSVTNAAKAALEQAFGKVDRYSGKDAYATSLSFARFALGQGMGANKMGVATAGLKDGVFLDGYWDALVGGAVCGANNAVLVLADDGHLGALQVATQAKEQIDAAYVFGGPYWISETGFARIKASTA